MDELRMRSYSEEILNMLSEEENDSTFVMTNRDLTNFYLKNTEMNYFLIFHI